MKSSEILHETYRLYKCKDEFRPQKDGRKPKLSLLDDLEVLCEQELEEGKTVNYVSIKVVSKHRHNPSGNRQRTYGSRRLKKKKSNKSLAALEAN